MAKRIVTKIGDIFCAEIDGKYKVYFQYIANDTEALNSSVIRVFQRRYRLTDILDVDEIVTDEILFYAHTVLRVGIEENKWYKVGKSDNLGLDKLENIYFGLAQSTYIDAELMQIIHCDPQENLVIWHVNHEKRREGKLTNENKLKIEYGGVVPVGSIISRIKLGYDPGCNNIYYHAKRVPWDDVDSYTKLEDSESEDVAYLHFVGKKAVAIVIVTPNGKVYLDEQHPKSGEFKMFEGDFGDINWKYNEFITAEEFNEVWGDHKW